MQTKPMGLIMGVVFLLQKQKNQCEIMVLL